MNAVFPDNAARSLCLQWMDSLEPSAFGSGRMLGLLVCTDGSVIRAFSGIAASYEGYAPPCFDIEKFNSMNRGSDSDSSRIAWKNLMKLYSFHCIDGSAVTLSGIFPNAPCGAGDCCAPRLLNHCFATGRHPLSMAEFFWGDGPYERGSFHNPCESRCRPVLKHMLGLDIVYCDNDIAVVNKPHGLLAIEGRVQKDCVAARIRRLYPHCIAQPCVHRLDQGTGGLMVLGLTKNAHDRLSLDFENRRVQKEYTALVDGVVTSDSGCMDMRMRADIENRPLQIPDPVLGKEAVTYYERVRVEKFCGRFVTRLVLHPVTGRTHQIRVHCRHVLGMPVVNDPLYGSSSGGNLCLYATGLSFDHPVTGRRLSFTQEPDF